MNIQNGGIFYELIYDYGYGDGREVICRADTLEEAEQYRQDYIENEHIYPTIRKRYKYTVTD